LGEKLEAKGQILTTFDRLSHDGAIKTKPEQRYTNIDMAINRTVFRLMDRKIETRSLS